jgi:hypothetical protein
MLEALRGKATSIGLELRDIEGLDPPKFALVRDDEVDGTYALVNDDGMPMFSYQEAKALIEDIDKHGSYEDWCDAVEDEEDEPLPDVLGFCRKVERAHMRDVYQDALADSPPDADDLRREIRVIVIQELMRHKLIDSGVPFDGEIIPPKR